MGHVTYLTNLTLGYGIKKRANTGAKNVLNTGNTGTWNVFSHYVLQGGIAVNMRECTEHFYHGMFWKVTFL